MRTICCLIFLIAMVSPSVPAQATDFGAENATLANTLTIWSSTDLDAFGPVIKAFLQGHPKVRVTYQDINTNELYQQAATACAADKPGADLVISSAIDLQIRLVNDGCAQAHRSPATESLPDWANWRNEIFGLTFEPVVIVYNRKLVPFDGKSISRFDLIDMLRADDATYNGKVITYDIGMSGVGYLFAFIDSLQATTFGRLIESFGRNHVVPTCCAAEILDAVASGRYLIGYNVLGSYAIARAKIDPRIGVLYPADYTLVLSRAGIIPEAAPNPLLAEEFLDFVLSAAGRKVLADTSLIILPHEELAGGYSLDLPGDSSLRPITPSPILLLGLDKEKHRIFTKVWRTAVGPAKPAP